MARPSRRHVALIVLTLVAWTAARSAAQAVSISRIDDAVNVAAPGFRFITGEPLDILEDGRSLRIDLELALLPRPGGEPVARTRETFVLSYDLWEERFVATKAGPDSRSAEYRSTSDAETWCLTQLAVPVSQMGSAADGTFWVHLSYRILDGDRTEADDAMNGDTIQSLIDALSRRRKAGEWTNSVEAGPFRLQP